MEQETRAVHVDGLVDPGVAWGNHGVDNLALQMQLTQYFGMKNWSWNLFQNLGSLGPQHLLGLDSVGVVHSYVVVQLSVELDTLQL